MNSFQYVTAHTPEEAIGLLGPNGRYLSGGIDLLGEMKDYIVSPDVLVNIKEMGNPYRAISLGPVASDSNKKEVSPAMIIGSQVTVAELAGHAEIKAKLPGLAEAASEVGSPQIRHVASLGGNLLQHSRCWYYRQPDITCLKRGGSTCHAQEGENKYSSLFSGCPCISPLVSNLAVALAALEGSAMVQQEASLSKAPGFHVYSMKELYQEAWENPQKHNSLKPEYFLSNVSVPLKRTRSAYRQMSEKSEFDWALVSCAAAGNVTGGKIFDVRIALEAVAPVPYLVEEAHHFLEGKPLTEENVSKAADIILKDAKPLAHNGYKVPLAHTLIRRTLLALKP